MTKPISRRVWLQRSAMAAAVLPISRWYVPESIGSHPLLPDANTAIRLNSNENPYGPGEAARKAIVDSLQDSNRYPWPYIDRLKEEIAKREGLTADHILVTPGSTELLGLAGLVYGLHDGELLACHPTFDFLLVYAEKLGCRWARTPVRDDFQYDLNALDRSTGPNTKLIFICNPNNPTGIEIPYADLKSFCQAQLTRYPVYVDEAYIELCSRGRKNSMVNLVHRHPNLIIGRTFSKVHGLAGMRIGYALAHPDTIKKLGNLSTGRSMSISVPACAAAIASLNDRDFEEMSREKIVEGRKMVSKTFDQWKVKHLPSATNFIFFQNEKFSMDPVPAMEQENILIRSYAHTPGWSRVSIGTTEEMNMFMEKAKKYVVS